MLLLTIITHIIFSIFHQGTNGSQLWDTAFAVQAFLEVYIFIDKTKTGA